MQNKITEFKGEHNWLSNFFPCNILVDGEWYPSVEHAYMSHKCDNPWWKSKCRDRATSAAEIKRLSKLVNLVEGWDDMRISVMQKCLEAKFRLPAFANKLIETGDAIIEEGNNWGDEFWGINLKTGAGSNNLGILILQIRNNIK